MDGGYLDAWGMLSVCSESEDQMSVAPTISHILMVRTRSRMSSDAWHIVAHVVRQCSINGAFFAKRLCCGVSLHEDTRTRDALTFAASVGFCYPLSSHTNHPGILLSNPIETFF